MVNMLSRPARVSPDDGHWRRHVKKTLPDQLRSQPGHAGLCLDEVSWTGLKSSNWLAFTPATSPNHSWNIEPPSTLK